MGLKLFFLVFLGFIMIFKLLVFICAMSTAISADLKISDLKVAYKFQTVVLKCSVDRLSDGDSLSWVTASHVSLSSAKKYDHIHYKKNGFDIFELIVNNATSLDSGFYSCVLANTKMVERKSVAVEFPSENQGAMILFGVACIVIALIACIGLTA